MIQERREAKNAFFILNIEILDCFTISFRLFHD
jgi:hypothetical protein